MVSFLPLALNVSKPLEGVVSHVTPWCSSSLTTLRDGRSLLDRWALGHGARLRDHHVDDGRARLGRAHHDLRGRLLDLVPLDRRLLVVEPRGGVDHDPVVLPERTGGAAPEGGLPLVRAVLHDGELRRRVDVVHRPLLALPVAQRDGPHLPTDVVEGHGPEGLVGPVGLAVAGPPRAVLLEGGLGALVGRGVAVVDGGELLEDVVQGSLSLVDEPSYCRK